MFSSKNEFNDGIVRVDTGVSIDSSETSSTRTDLNNAIRITVNSDKPKPVHFIQFVTRQFPDIRTFNESGRKILQWEEVEYFFTTNLEDPKWKLDVFKRVTFVDNYFLKDDDLNKTIYYEEKGAGKSGKSRIYVCDQPGPNQSAERCVACTFVVIDNQVSHLVRWSIQADEKENEFYCVDVRIQKHLSYWAEALISEKYSDLAKMSEGYNKLLLNQPRRPEGFDIKKESREDFLQWPNNWFTRREYPGLFPTKFIPTKKSTEETFSTTERKEEQFVQQAKEISLNELPLPEQANRTVVEQINKERLGQGISNSVQQTGQNQTLQTQNSDPNGGINVEKIEFK